MNIDEIQARQLDALVVEFTHRLRMGEGPSIDDYACRYPELAEAIHSLFPTILSIEDLKRRRKNTPAPGKLPSQVLTVNQETPVYEGSLPREELDFSKLFHPTQAENELGVLGCYRIRKLIGSGGMGVVFLAEDARLHRLVALKIMRPEEAEKEGAKARFLREARLAASIESDFIVTIFQVDEDRGMPFIAMSLLRGKTLEERLATGPTLSISQIVQIGREVAGGLAAAHARGLIHRDVKPANIWLEQREAETVEIPLASGSGSNEKTAIDFGRDIPAIDFRVKVLDFGLARAITCDAGITTSGVVVGTPAYMSPEQARGEAIDGRADLFSLGVVLYRLTTGRLPFVGKNAASTLMSLATFEPEAPALLNPSVPAALSSLILQLLSKDAAKRPRSAQSVATSLAQISVNYEPSIKKRSRPRLLAAVGLAILTGLMLSYFLGGDLVRSATQSQKRDENRRTPDQGIGPDATPAPQLAVAPFDAKEAREHQEAWAKHLGLPLEYSNTINLRMRLIPPGKFRMGAGEDDKSTPQELPTHEVLLSRPFYAGIHEVTIAQFREFVKAVGYLTETETDGRGTNRHVPPGGEHMLDHEASWKAAGFVQAENHPVVHISWNDARAFCAWLSEKEKKTYRLLTEAEWEYCCRAGTTTRFYWGDDEIGARDHANFADASYKNVFNLAMHPTVPWEDGFDFTAPVGSYNANPFGLHDMHGNVWEWVQDRFSAGSYESPLSAKDPVGPSEGNTRVLRGGSWMTMPWYGRASFRDGGSPPHARYDHIGFRVMCEIDQAAKK